MTGGYLHEEKVGKSSCICLSARFYSRHYRVAVDIFRHDERVVQAAGAKG
jgi:hypothetical protein